MRKFVATCCLSALVLGGPGVLAAELDCERLKMKALGAYAEQNSFNAKIAQAESDEDSVAVERYGLLKDKWLAKSGDLSSVYTAFCN